MSAFTYRIADEIFQRYPGYVRGVVIAHELANGPSPQALLDLLRPAEATGRTRFALLARDQPSISLAA